MIPTWLDFWYTRRGRGEPCKRGESAASDGCIPASRSGKPGTRNPSRKERKQQSQARNSQPSTPSAEHVEQALAPAVQQMEQSQEGRVTLAQGEQVATGLRGKITRAIASGLQSLDESSHGGVSMVLGGVKGGGFRSAVQGVAQIIGSVFHLGAEREVFENAMSQHSIPAAALVGSAVAGVAAKAQSKLFTAVAWAMAKMSGKSATGEHKDMASKGTGDAMPSRRSDSDIRDQMLAVMARATVQALADLYKRSGVDMQLPSVAEMGERLRQGMGWQKRG